MLKEYCKEMGIDTAMESTGFADYEIIKRYLPYLDHYLMDIKHMDSKKHEAFTTKPNEKILENARRIARDCNHLIIRTPVIPTFNDTPEEIGAILDSGNRTAAGPTVPPGGLYMTHLWYDDGNEKFEVENPITF